MTRGAGQHDTSRAARRRGMLVLLAATVLLLGGGSAVAVGLVTQQSAPNPPKAAMRTGISPSSAAIPTTGSDTAPTTAAPAPPTIASGTTAAADKESESTAPPATTALIAGAHPPAGNGHPSQVPTSTVRTSGTSHTPAAPATRPPAPAAARPVHLRIPAIGVDTDLIVLGLNPEGSLAVPQPGPDYDKAAWFDGSPAPGDVGPAVIEGHIDSAANGPSVFFDLGALQPDDQIFVDRSDGSTVSFTVDAVRSYPKDEFPKLTVYGNTTGPELRLITCGGDFDSTAGSYLNNTVVYARRA